MPLETVLVTVVGLQRCQIYPDNLKASDLPCIAGCDSSLHKSARSYKMACISMPTYVLVETVIVRPISIVLVLVVLVAVEAGILKYETSMWLQMALETQL